MSHITLTETTRLMVTQGSWPHITLTEARDSWSHITLTLALDPKQDTTVEENTTLVGAGSG